jgi:LPS export ABC transporter protein LptC
MPGRFPLRTYILIFVLLGTGIFFYFHTGKKLIGAKVPPRDQISSSSSLRITDLFYARTEGERLSLKVRADSAEYRENPRIANLENIRAQVYPKSGGEIRIFSDSGQYDLDREILSLPGDVTAITHDGLKIGSGKGSFNNKLKELVFESFLTVTGPNLYARGDLLKIDTHSGKLTIEHGIEADLTPARIRTLLQIQNPGGNPGAGQPAKSG